ncbi:hypothetical protein [Aquimarina algicola]|uniref:Uncharacterized protein n=1 Tax=Aquimarina algicola TaxID=2589995 RepID=A0A504JEG9_9FLAO|nr:hypothetical protein [Aquimarina algicola]TPN89084.1 hypothetical protein FHK87_02360 [Aquimarina algicola]
MSLSPYYMIDFSASACMFEIRINDYPVITQNIEGQVSTLIPINYAVLENGEQYVSATMLPNPGEIQLHPKADLRYKVMLFDVANDFVFQEQFEEFQSKPVGDQKLPIIKNVDAFNAEVPFQLKAWQNGQDLNEVKDVKKKLIMAYNDLADIIKNGNYGLFQEKIKNRELNMSTSMYLSNKEAQDRVSSLISDFESGFQVMPVIEQNTALFIYANGKAAALKKPNGESALYLLNPKTKEELMLDLTFYIPEEKSTFEII